MSKKAKSIRTFSFFVCIVVVAGMLVYYQYMNRERAAEAEKIPSTEVEKLIAKDMEQGYPETPKGVVELYCRIKQCLYKGAMTDEESDSILKQMRVLYAADFLSANPLEKQKQQLGEDIQAFKNDKKSILSYTIDSSALQYKTIHNKECTVVQAAFFLRESSEYKKSYEKFMLAKEDGKWKILGFQPAQATTVMKDEDKNEGKDE